MKAQPRLSLHEALATNRLREFIAHEEKRGVGSANRKEFNAVVKKLAKTAATGSGR